MQVTGLIALRRTYRLMRQIAPFETVRRPQLTPGGWGIFEKADVTITDALASHVQRKVQLQKMVRLRSQFQELQLLLLRTHRDREALLTSHPKGLREAIEALEKEAVDPLLQNMLDLLKVRLIVLETMDTCVES